MSIFTGLFRSRDKPVRNTILGNTYSFFFGSTTSGKMVNERTALQTTVPIKSLFVSRIGLRWLIQLIPDSNAIRPRQYEKGQPVNHVAVFDDSIFQFCYCAQLFVSH
jgi:hypothetical protein